MPPSLLTRISDETYLSRRAPPTANDGRYDSEISQNPHLATTASHSSFTNFVKRIATLSDKHYPVDIVDGFVDQALHPTAIDDRKLAVRFHPISLVLLTHASHQVRQHPRLSLRRASRHPSRSETLHQGRKCPLQHGTSSPGGFSWPFPRLSSSGWRRQLS